MVGKGLPWAGQLAMPDRRSARVRSRLMQSLEPGGQSGWIARL